MPRKTWKLSPPRWLSDSPARMSSRSLESGDTQDVEREEIRDVARSWEVVTSQERFRARVITVRTDGVRMPEGEVVDRDYVTHPGSVGVVAVDDEDRVLMIRQYRHPVRHLLWEIPAGLRDV